MHRFFVFWIKEEFCYHYFYKSDILYRFLQEYMDNHSREDLRAQFIYVTRMLPYRKLVAHVKRQHPGRIMFTMDDINETELKLNNSPLFVQQDERYMTVTCTSVQEADQLLFEPLKSFHPSFFIIESGTTNAGWITPVKKEVLL